ncbi:MAG TPA: hypothetical protein PKU97_17605, partial [Kofleriaceae bacterium]|nr:hypothetical protein [Kofleriaceae bacterium]
MNSKYATDSARFGSANGSSAEVQRKVDAGKQTRASELSMPGPAVASHAGARGGAQSSQASWAADDDFVSALGLGRDVGPDHDAGASGASGASVQRKASARGAAQQRGALGGDNVAAG